MSNKPTYEELEQRVKELEQVESERKRTEVSLRESERRFRTLIKTAPTVILHLSPEGRILDLNPEAESFYGCKRAEALGQNYLESFLPEEARKPVLMDIKKVLRGKRTRSYENPVTDVDGIERLMIWDVAPLLDDQKETTGIIAVGQDITKRKQAEEQLRESEEKYRLLVENLPSITWVTSEHGKTTFISPNVEKMFGYTQEEVYEEGESAWLGRIHPDDVEQVKESFEAMFAEQKKFDVEYRIQQKDGEWIWLHDLAMRAFEKDNIWYAYGVFSDITERKLAEAELLFKENIIKSSSSVITTCNLEGSLTYGNPSFLKIWGFDDDKEFSGRHFSEFWVVKERLDEILQTLRSKGKWFGELKAKRKDGSLFDVQVSAATVYDVLGNPVALTSTSIDITERKQAEEEIKKLRGILPLCSYCKKVRDDDGYWEQVDVYIYKYSEADISHSICPECMKKHYPDEYASIDSDKNKD
jgi:two-component system cell cycle sensor histidine kinase/response regulator CckA